MFYNIRMSLYEQFHSDINKEFMFDMVKKLILKEISIDISLDSENYDYYLTTFTKIFNDNDAEEIEEMNKYLLDHNIDYMNSVITVFIYSLFIFICFIAISLVFGGFLGIATIFRNKQK